MKYAEELYAGTIKQAQMAAITHNRVAVARYRTKARRSGENNAFIMAFTGLMFHLTASYHDSYDDFLESSTREIEALRD